MKIIRLIQKPDLTCVYSLYAAARERMKTSGNPDQWKDAHPSKKLIEGDLENGTGYVVEEGGNLVGVFALLSGKDPTYDSIAGEWLCAGPYLTIHRVAGDGIHKGVFETILRFCEQRAKADGALSLRADTHERNQIMRHLLEKNGFRFCGIIHVADGSPRLAFQKALYPECSPNS